MKQILVIIISVFANLVCLSQSNDADSLRKALNFQKDSTLRSLMHMDSAKVEKEFAEKMRWAGITSSLTYPVLKGGEYSGVVPYSGLTEIPDPNLTYKLLFEVTANNPDSVSSQINFGLGEVARVINLHVASGIPLKKIIPVIVVHAGALKAISTNEYYR